ncbi:unnamed protein product [Rotaria sp. Silwood1]|nr:unnamed protein product [Rotaria sp. Silwood1]CAF1337236.1 unnamed protein product [Rotaria sp. Silwood1]CAF3508198.1 unnamed protein product [Rotaria sp. Silwood1]CAF3581575.1 unnamed protein product [Rotaria sp. Silwood1]CAF4550525.1 unnamed protein product [Rotaria sp. Silwood1]
MSLLLTLPLLFIQFLLTNCDNLPFNTSNCSLSFIILANYQSNIIPTKFPIEFIANYNLTCNIPNLTAYYKIIPLDILIIGSYEAENESIKSMIELYTKTFYFKINQPSTIRLCVLSSNNDDDVDDNDYQICRQIHIGINTLYNLWNLPMKVFYILLISSVGSYHVLFFLRERWRKGWKPSKPTRPVIKRASISETKHDTFENEKVNEENMSGEEDEV